MGHTLGHQQRLLYHHCIILAFQPGHLTLRLRYILHVLVHFELIKEERIESSQLIVGCTSKHVKAIRTDNTTNQYSNRNDTNQQASTSEEIMPLPPSGSSAGHGRPRPSLVPPAQAL